jgi:formylmethanofuran dehydrogenase subunit B
VKFTCPTCGRNTDVRIEAGSISVGYVCAAGSAHFCGVEDVAVDGLEAWSDGTDLTVRISIEEWTIEGIDDT